VTDHDNNIIFERYCSILNEFDVPHPTAIAKGDVFILQDPGNPNDGQYHEITGTAGLSNTPPTVTAAPIPSAEAGAVPTQTGTEIDTTKMRPGEYMMKSQRPAASSAANTANTAGGDKEEPEQSELTKPITHVTGSLQQGAQQYNDPLGQYAFGKLHKGAQALVKPAPKRGEGIFGYE